MNYFPLFNLLPCELVYMIYLIVLKEKCANKICRFYKLRRKKHIVMIDLLMNVLDDNNYYIANIKDNIIISNDNIETLKFALNNKFALSYDRFFWQKFLDTLSANLMRIHTGILMANLNNNKNSCYINLKSAIQLWFALCQKYNLRLRLYYNNFKGCGNIMVTEISARKMLKIKNFNKFIYAPVCI